MLKYKIYFKSWSERIRIVVFQVYEMSALKVLQNHVEIKNL